MIVFIYSHDDEKLTSILKNNLKKKECIILSIKHLLNDFSIFDTFVDGQAKINWFDNCNTQITNDNSTILINRVLDVPRELFQHFHENDRNYAKREFEAYLSFALSAFKHKVGNASPMGLAGRFFSLINQWQRIKNHTHIKTPEYFYGPRTHLPSHFHNQSVCGSLFDYGNWQVSDMKSEDIGNKLYYKRPHGIPIFAFLAGKDVVLAQLSNHQLELIDDKRIEKITLQIGNLFNYPFAEILFFKNGENISFGCINQSINAPWPDSILDKAVNQFIYKLEKSYEFIPQKNIYPKATAPQSSWC